MLDGSGAKVAESRYYPYGQQRRSSGTLPTDYRFTGQQQIDSADGLYHMGARFYDPYINRFLSPDSIIPDFSNPQNVNRYLYVNNRPLNYVDPTGHWGIGVHYSRTMSWAWQIEMKVFTYRNPPLDVTPDNLYETIANADIGVDVNGIREVIGGGRKCGQTPDPKLGGATHEQYYHYPRKADAEARLMKAIEDKDPTAFGQALHSYQDYYAHTLTGFTASENDIGSLFSNCPECFENESYEVLFERAEGQGHDGILWPDHFDLSEQRAIDMQNGTQWYILLFILEVYDIDLEQYLADTGSTPASDGE